MRLVAAAARARRLQSLTLHRDPLSKAHGPVSEMDVRPLAVQREHLSQQPLLAEHHIEHAAHAQRAAERHGSERGIGSSWVSAVVDALTLVSLLIRGSR